MIVEKDNALELLKEKGTRFIYPLKMGGEIIEPAFSELLTVAEELTKLYKNEELIPKKILLELYLISVGIDCENYHIKQELLSNMSEFIMRCFNMLISGESVDDVKASGPRII
ncbi:hypothetical protein [Symbiopectobacterium purcellii]|uniref:Uncharacterized protein n=1 Tax=Symbiopectobacterium purcellii TaxID=2871826 RepID=A0ABX9AUF4_9ENTR|nr:hypothetical protein [Symbiopectobacterium purcellii]QZN97395.1 hypothetical protein K6K13_08725 [Symbiopectobacterium purcellii]